MEQPIFRLAGILIDGKEVEISDVGGLVRLDCKPQEPLVNEARRLLGQTFTLRGTFTPTPAFWGFIVGLQLQYNLRQLHQNLGRYTRWPYTN